MQSSQKPRAGGDSYYTVLCRNNLCTREYIHIYIYARVSERARKDGGGSGENKGRRATRMRSPRSFLNGRPVPANGPSARNVRNRRDGGRDGAICSVCDIIARSRNALRRSFFVPDPPISDSISPTPRPALTRDAGRTTRARSERE